MRYLIILILLQIPFLVSSQSIVSTRTAVLQKGGYNISGNAILEEYDNGDLKLRLDSNFATPAGPDVQVFLSNSTSISGALQIEDIGTQDGLNHFSGEIVFNVPGGTTIDKYSHVVFQCVIFNAFWGFGEFGETNADTVVVYECKESATATTNWVTELHICSGDDEPDSIPLLNNVFEPAGTHYAFIITDTQNVVKQLYYEDTLDFEGRGTEPERIYGISYTGDLSFIKNGDIATVKSTGCYTLSSQSLFLTVYKDACATGIEDAVENSALPYPNPTSGYFSVEADQIEVLDLTGKTIIHTDEQKIDLSSYPVGIYLVKAKRNNHFKVSRVLVTR